MSQEKCKLFENILLLKLGHKKNDKWTGLNNLILSTHEFGSREYFFSIYYFSCSLIWRWFLPHEERSIDIYYSQKNMLEAISILTAGLGSSWVSHRILDLCWVSVQLPSKAHPWGLITTICLRAITLTKEMKSYKWSNRRNTRTTGQNDQILNHAWNSSSPKSLICIQLGSQKVWVKCPGSDRLRLHFHWSWTRRYMGPGAPIQGLNVTATFSPLTVQLCLGEFVEGLFGLGSFFTGRFTLSRYF